MSEPSVSSAKAWRAIIYSLAGVALLVVILRGVVTGEAFPLLNSNATAASICWVCPVWLLAATASLMGVVTGFAALSELKAKQPLETRGKAWSAVVFGCLVIAVLISLAIYFVNRGLMH